MRLTANLLRNTMKAIRVRQFGGPEVLKVETNVPIPKPQNNQVLIKVFATGVNPVETYIRSGNYAALPELPYTPGKDVAGIVEDFGSEVSRFERGDRVFTFNTVSGGCAEYCLADVSTTQHLHDNLTFEQGAGVGVPYYTAYRAVQIVGKGKAGETILIHGASGSVGLACVQCAHFKGMKVLGTAGTPAGMELIRSFGADGVFNHREDDYTQKIMEATNGTGPDLIIEMLANVNLQKDLIMVAKKGRVVVVGSRGNIEVTPRLTMGKECSVTGMLLFNASQEEWKEMNAAISSGMHHGWVHPHIAKEYTLEQTGTAHNDVINNSGAHGRLVIKL